MTLERPLAEKMERTDSGFGDCPAAARRKFSIATRQSSVTSPDTGTSSRDHSQSRSQRTVTSQRNRPDMRRTRHPSTSQRGISRQSSVPAYISQSYPSSRSSSLILHHPATTTPWNSPLRSRTHSIRSETIDPYVFYRECKSLFDPPTSRPTSTSSSTANNSSHIDDPPTPRAPLPQPTIVDWTLPSTRRREYKAIEASTKGFRGLWRRYAPRKWQRGRSLGFTEEVDGDGSDGGSVRRYRIDFEDETGDGEEKDGEKDDEKDGDGHGEKEKTIQEHRICGWSCFGKKS